MSVKRRPGRPRLTEPSPEHLARRQQLIDTAAEVFRAKGYDAGSLDDVAAALDLRKASLYYYVRSKAELLYLIFDRAITLALSRLEEILAVEDARQRLALLIRHQVLTIAGEPGLFTVFFDQRAGLDHERAQEIRAKERHYLGVYAKAVAQATSESVIPPVDARYAAQAIIGMTSWIYKWLDPKRDDPEQIADTCVRLILGDRP